jgi:adenylate kinase
MYIVFLGPPGCGKGTYAKLLSEKYNFIHISTGDILRESVRKGDVIAERVKKFIDKGVLVPDEIILEIIENYLVNRSDENVVFDGFPRTVEQAIGLKKILEKINKKTDMVLSFVIDKEQIVKRIIARRICPTCGRVYNLISIPPKNNEICDGCNIKLIQRSDDTRETILNRIDVYHSKTEPLVKYYQDKEILKNIELICKNLKLTE